MPNETIETSRSGNKLLLRANRGTRKHSLLSSSHYKLLEQDSELYQLSIMSSLLNAWKPSCSLLSKTQFLRIVLQLISQSFQMRSTQKFEDSQTNLQSYVSYMFGNPNIAHRKFILWINYHVIKFEFQICVCLASM